MRVEVTLALENHYAPEPVVTHSVTPNPFEGNPSYTPFFITTDKSAKTFVNRALKILGPGKPIVITGSGEECTKAVTCAELIKTNYFKKVVHQITKVSQIRTIEMWEPITEGLDALSVTRSVPLIHILLSLENLDDHDEGYQKSSREPKRIVSNPQEDELPSPLSPIHFGRSRH